MGYFDDWASSPITTIGLPLLAGGLATRNPTTARGVGIGLGTLNLIQQAQARNEEDQRRQKLAQVLPSLIGATTPVTTTGVGVSPQAAGVNPQTATYSLPDNNSQYASLGNTPASSPSNDLFAPPQGMTTFKSTENKPVFSPGEQSIYTALAQYAPEAVAQSALSRVAQKDTQPHFYSDPNTGDLYAINPTTLEKTLVNKGTPKPSAADVLKGIGGSISNLPPGVTISQQTAGGGRVNLAYPEAANQAKAKRIPPSVAQAIGTPNFNAALKAAQDSGEIGEEGVVAAMAQQRAELANQRADKASTRADAASARADKLATARLNALNQTNQQTETVAPISLEAKKGIASTLNALVKDPNFQKLPPATQNAKVGAMLKAQGAQLAPGVDMQDFIKSSQGILSTSFDPNSLPVVQIPKVGKGRGIPLSATGGSSDLQSQINKVLGQ